MKRLLIAAIVMGLTGIPCMALTSLGSVTLTAVKARIFTPNGDGFNDKARFELENPELLPVTGSVYDFTGARVASLAPAVSPANEALVWDGKDENGSTVPAGIYIYQIEFQGEKATGTVVVSR